MGREELLRAEQEGFEALSAEVAKLSSDQVEEPGLTPEGWSVKDLLWHISRWCEELSRVLQEMRLGTFKEEDHDFDDEATDAQNRAFFEASKNMSLSAVRAEADAARDAMLQEFRALPEVTEEAEEWFEEEGSAHYTDHLEDVRRWVEKLTASA